jgi:dihydrofolate reductase
VRAGSASRHRPRIAPVAWLILSTTMTVDGVITVSEWFVPGGEHADAAHGLLEQSAGMVLGRKTYEGLAAYWPEQEGPWGDLLNPMPKFVASRTLAGGRPLDWNATLIEGDAVEGVRRLKDEAGRDLVLIGCGELARELIGARLVDEAWSWVHPAIWGDGERPLAAEDLKLRMELVGVESFDSGVALLRYRP